MYISNLLGHGTVDVCNVCGELLSNRFVDCFSIAWADPDKGGGRRSNPPEKSQKYEDS